MATSAFEFSSHARDMLQERNVPEEWVQRTLRSPNYTEVGDDDTVHYIMAVPEFGGRFLRVVVNPNETPIRVVTFFFDRRLRVQS